MLYDKKNLKPTRSYRMEYKIFIFNYLFFYITFCFQHSRKVNLRKIAGNFQVLLLIAYSVVESFQFKIYFSQMFKI